MQYDNNLRGVLFQNGDKRDGKRDPDYRGNAEVDGKQYWLDGWINSSKDGSKRFLSLRFKLKEARQNNPVHREPAKPGQTSGSDDWDDPIPF